MGRFKSRINLERHLNAHLAGVTYGLWCATRARPTRNRSSVGSGGRVGLSRLRGGGDVPAPPIGQPSDRSIGAQSRLQIRDARTLRWRRLLFFFLLTTKSKIRANRGNSSGQLEALSSEGRPM